MMDVGFYKSVKNRNELGDIQEQFELLGTAECDVTPLKRSKMREEDVNTQYTAQTTTKVFLYSDSFKEATHFEFNRRQFEIVGLNDYNDEGILCFEGVRYERN